MAKKNGANKTKSAFNFKEPKWQPEQGIENSETYISGIASPAESAGNIQKSASAWDKNGGNSSAVRVPIARRLQKFGSSKKFLMSRYSGSFRIKY
ncbi:MAG: hypothetical protein LBH29_03100 [Elusimicrobiota bacterium]|jgi:hypothetical protein|nr:hypothetical protein [Elusimicrobiota bacterium]